MKTTLGNLWPCLVLGVFAAVPTAWAAEGAPPAKETRAAVAEKRSLDDRIATIEKTVGTLNAGQKEKLKKAFTQAEAAGEKLRSQKGDTKAAMARAQEIQRTMVRQIREALEPGQQNKFDAMLGAAAAAPAADARPRER